jgi:hypothetical protein
MRKIILINIAMLLCLFSCNDKDVITTEYLDDGYKTHGLFLDKLKEGKHISFYSNGNIRQVKNYHLDTLEGEDFLIYEDSVKNKIYRKNGKLYKQVVTDRGGDTTYIYNRKDKLNENTKAYFNKKPILFGSINNGIEKEMKFDTLGKIKLLLNPPIDFLTKKDSYDLDRAYPDWKEQVKRWEEKNKK